jgi:AcrR family transcriptional regulator
MKRQYVMRERAESADHTRRRIIEAAIALYAARGPADTTISAVAGHAGVQRLTVYRHFPDERLLLDACWDYWAVMHPLPALHHWETIADPRQRLRAVLDALYIYYEAAGALLERLLIDRDRMPALVAVMAPYDQWVAGARQHLLEGWGVHGRPRQWIVALIDHALRFTTWASLSRSGTLQPGDASRLLCRAVADIARDPYG